MVFLIAMETVYLHGFCMFYHQRSSSIVDLLGRARVHVYSVFAVAEPGFLAKVFPVRVVFFPNEYDKL